MPKIIKIKDYEEFLNPKNLNGEGYKSTGFKSLKEFLDYYYIIPKCRADMTKEDLDVINKFRVYFTSDNEITGMKFLMTKPRSKKFNAVQVNEIKVKYHEKHMSYKKLANEYECCIGTIKKVIKDTY